MQLLDTANQSRQAGIPLMLLLWCYLSEWVMKTRTSVESLTYSVDVDFSHLFSWLWKKKKSKIIDLSSLWCFESLASPLCILDVGGYFESGTLVRYDFLPEAGLPVMREMKSLSGVGVPNEANLTQEELVFSFSTSNAPSILVYVSSRTSDYLAVVLRHNGQIMILYRDIQM